MLTLHSDLRNHLRFVASSIFVINIRDIEYFAAVAEHRHVGRAAEALGLSQSGLSMSLRRLEQSVQAKVFKRTPKGVELTTVGTVLLSRVCQLRLVHDDVIREVADLGQGLAGHLRIGVSPGIAEDLTAAACAALAKQAPRATLKIAVGTFNVLLPALRSGELDFIFGGISKSPHEGLCQQRLHEDRFVVYASASHRLARRKQVTLADVAKERWITTDTFILWQELRGAFKQYGHTPPAITIETSSASIRQRVVSSSDLLGFSSRLFVRQSAQRFRLAELPIKELSVSRPLGVSYRKDAYLSPTARRFIEMLKVTVTEVAAGKR